MFGCSTRPILFLLDIKSLKAVLLYNKSVNKFDTEIYLLLFASIKCCCKCNFHVIPHVRTLVGRLVELSFYRAGSCASMLLSEILFSNKFVHQMFSKTILLFSFIPFIVSQNK